MLDFNRYRTVIANSDVFLVILMAWTVVMPLFLFSMVPFFLDYRAFTLKHLLYVFSYLLLQFQLTKYVPHSSTVTLHYDGFKTSVIKYNGPACTALTFVLFLVLNFFNVMDRKFIIRHFKQLIYAKIVIALISTVWVYLATSKSRDKSKSLIYNFFWGNEHFPIINGVHLKIVNNCRFGMTLWLIYITGFLIGHYEIYGTVTNSLMVNYILTLLYLYKFFIWEDGYYNTLDIIMDKLGYWLIYGCMVYVPCIYTFATYYFAINKTDPLSLTWYLLILIVGTLAICYNYITDLDKYYFKQSDGQYINNNEPARYLYNEKGQKLLINGWWGWVRKPNYVFELILAFCFCCCHGFQSVLPYTYFIILFGLLICRIYIDEERCMKKYGQLYEDYKNIVKYKLIPYIY